MDQVKSILNHHFPGKEWRIQKPAEGASKESLIGISDEQSVFIKLDVENHVLDRLSELGLTPKVLAEGNSPRPYVIQEYIEGTQPDWEWFPKHLPLLAETFRKFHSDAQLKELLGGEGDYDDHINEELTKLEKIYPVLRKSEVGGDELENLYQMFRVQTKHLTVTPLVPVHADPNNHNIILSGEKMYLVDWDDILLSDPMHDIGLLLFWYVPKDRWPEFFSAYGLDLDEDRIYWWIARGSLSIAHWFYKREDLEKTKMFLSNFKAAVMKEENPGFITPI